MAIVDIDDEIKRLTTARNDAVAKVEQAQTVLNDAQQVANNLSVTLAALVNYKTLNDQISALNTGYTSHVAGL